MHVCVFSKALDVILPKKEAGPYITDFKYLSEKGRACKSIVSLQGVAHRQKIEKECLFK
jgi:hypothetical protein